LFPWRDTIYYHYYDYPGWYSIKQQWGVRTSAAKLIVFNNATASTDAASLQYEMYDLATDPNEAHNLYNNADYAEL